MQRNLRLQAIQSLRLVPLGVGLLLAGCGGGGGSTSGSSGPTQTNQLGPIGVSFTGHPQAPVTATSSQVTALGQAGASFSTLSFNPAHNLASTSIAFTRYFASQGALMYTLPAAGGQPASLMLHQGNTGYPTFSQSGVIAFDNGPGPEAIVTMLGDGSQQKTVVPSVIAFPAISPNGATIAYTTNDGTLYTVPSGGGTPTSILNPANAELLPPVWSPSGTQIAFTGSNSALSQLNVYTMSSTGANVTDVTSTYFLGGSTTLNSWSPDGLTLACTYATSGSPNTAVVLFTLTGSFASTLTPSNFNDSLPSFSPDGTKIAFYRTSVGGATPGIYVSDFAGTNLQLVLPDPTTGETGPVTSITWSPFPANKNFVGAGGTITASPVAGYLVSQNASQFASLLTFTATTPSTATITQSASNVNGASLIFSLGADSITNISYANVYSGAHSSIPLTATPSTLVTVDAATGLVDYVIPTVAGKAHPAVSRSTGSSVAYSGSFSAIYDSSGRNLAPSGASTVDFDRSTGKLISFR